jgi:hypothetical protein
METIHKPAVSKFRMSAYAFAILLFLLLDWAALHDIIKGEENTFAEYSMLVISIIVIPLFAYKILKTYSERKI